MLVTNSLADLIQQPCDVQHRGEAGFTVKIGYKPLSAFFRANLDRTRQIWPAAWCGLHYVSCQREFNASFVLKNHSRERVLA